MNSKAQEIYLVVQDHYFDSHKAQILISALSRSRVDNFTYMNAASGFNMKGDNFS